MKDDAIQNAYEEWCAPRMNSVDSDHPRDAFAAGYLAAIALMRGQSWQDIATCPRGDRRVILLISMNGPNGYITDPWTGWMNSDGTFARWPHEFPPTHWRSIEPKYPEKPKDTADE